MASTAPIETMQLEFERMLQRNIKGLGYFSSAAPVLGATPKDTLVAQGPWRLYHYHPRVDEVDRVPVVLVMATTNRGYIFDMVPGQSLVEFLLDRGYDVYMIDWEAPRSEDRGLTLANYVFDFVGGSIERVKANSGERDVSLLGYCMGGVLSVLWSALEQASGPANLAVFTTPVNFKAMTMFQAWSDERYSMSIGWSTRSALRRPTCSMRHSTCCGRGHGSRATFGLPTRCGTTTSSRPTVCSIAGAATFSRSLANTFARRLRNWSGKTR